MTDSYFVDTIVSKMEFMMNLSNKIITTVALIIVAVLVITGFREDASLESRDLHNNTVAQHAATSPP